MEAKKLIVVLGATGNQGGSVAEVFLQEPQWRVRAVTRNPASTKARALAARGAEVVQADLDLPSTLLSAFENANAIFAVSDFWGIFGDPANEAKAKGQQLNVWAANHETEQLKAVIDVAARIPTLERFVLSSLSNATKWSRGRYTHVYHFDSKAKAEAYGRETYPELWKKTSIFQAGFYLSNYVSLPVFKPVITAHGKAQFVSNLDPDVKLPFIAAEEDTGPIVKALVQEDAGKNIIGYREWSSLRELSKAFSQATGAETECIRLATGQSNIPLPSELLLELGDNWAYCNEFGYEGRDDPTIIHPKDLDSPPELDSVVNYFRKQDWSEVFTQEK
ncbi:NmrA-like family protein [Penicillium canescens]|uniref:NmrA-like family protein n=1 Tax=Penicillium canescens TaxID=5083 RepID=A0AAD6NEB2_PENCN|nr:NmrA-like family protein [Penicillium canescens]KAJ6032927.1 NmrA-like family protein [Penicillium canescens]KAJ6057883.1 NmrA-like family protein [Penicillium canescens]KAJ6059197.1 NmrA-like family protein [Penicillium canescens]